MANALTEFIHDELSHSPMSEELPVDLSDLAMHDMVRRGELSERIVSDIDRVMAEAR